MSTKTKNRPKVLGDVFTERFKGPYQAVLEDGSKMPALHRKDENGWGWSEDCDHEGGKVVDSTGKLVCNAANYVAAMTIAYQLNKVGGLYGPESQLGVTRNFKLCQDNKFTFWAIVIDWTTKNEEGVVRSTERYLAPFWQGIWSEPSWSNWAIDALRFNSKIRAEKALEYIKDVIMKRPEIQELCEKHPDWPINSMNTARVTKVYWLTRDALPDEGFAYVHDKEGNTIKCRVSDFGIVTPYAKVTNDGLVKVPEDYHL